MLPVCY